MEVGREREVYVSHVRCSLSIATAQLLYNLERHEIRETSKKRKDAHIWDLPIIHLPQATRLPAHPSDEGNVERLRSWWPVYAHLWLLFSSSSLPSLVAWSGMLWQRTDTSTQGDSCFCRYAVSLCLKDKWTNYTVDRPTHTRIRQAKRTNGSVLGLQSWFVNH